jgi:UDP-N-acetylglucosamine 2-epimerase (non-hydrolysing)
MDSVSAPLRLHIIAGARPDFMKVAPVLRAMSRKPDLFAPTLIDTGQHYGREMRDVFFEELCIPLPDFQLNVGGGSHAKQSARIMCAYEEICSHEVADLSVVVGDVNSTLACSIVAKKAGMQVAHVEAGLRSGDWSMPDEVNRVITDSISDFCFATEPDAVTNLMREGKRPHEIYLVGQVMIDNLMHQLKRLNGLGQPPSASTEIKRRHGSYAVVTLHRPNNVDNVDTLSALADAINQTSERLPVIFPVHPRTRQRLESLNIKIGSRTELTPPLSFMDFLNLWKDARVVLTDSGGLQEETTALGVPCLTLRENTERPITVFQGTNRVVGTSCKAIVDAVDEILNGNSKTSRRPHLWDGCAAERIVAVLASKYFWLDGGDHLVFSSSDRPEKKEQAIAC